MAGEPKCRKLSVTWDGQEDAGAGNGSVHLLLLHLEPVIAAPARDSLGAVPIGAGVSRICGGEGGGFRKAVIERHVQTDSLTSVNPALIGR